MGWGSPTLGSRDLAGPSEDRLRASDDGGVVNAVRRSTVRTSWGGAAAGSRQARPDTLYFPLSGFGQVTSMRSSETRRAESGHSPHAQTPVSRNWKS